MESRIAIVTGGASGLGYELVKLLISGSFRVCVVDIDAKKLAHIKKEYGDSIITECGNIADQEFALNVVERCNAIGIITLLINNGGSPSFKEPENYNNYDVEKCFEGLKGMIFFSGAVLSEMKKNGGKIINIMSSAALRGNAKESVYCATKWGERGYTESLRKSCEGTLAHIYAVYPGGINTDFYKNSRDYVSTKKQRSFMKAKDVAKVIFQNIVKTNTLFVDDLVINRIK